MKTLIVVLALTFSSMGYGDAIPPQLSIKTNILLSPQDSPIKTAQEWAKCSAYYSVGAAYYGQTTELKAVSEQLKGLARGAKLAVFMVMYLYPAGDATSPEQINSIVAQAKVASESWADVWVNSIGVGFELATTEEETLELIEGMGANIKICTSLASVQQGMIDLYRNMILDGSLIIKE